MFPKENRARIARIPQYSPERSPRKSHISILDHHLSEFDEIPIEKNRAMSHKKLEVVSSTQKASITFAKPQSQANIENRKVSKNVCKQNLQMIWKKSGVNNQQKEKLSLKWGQNQNQPPLKTITNQHPNPKIDWADELNKLRNHFQREIMLQHQTITTLTLKIQELNQSISHKNQQILALKQQRLQTPAKELQVFNRKLLDFQKIILVQGKELAASQNKISAKVEAISNKLIGKTHLEFVQLKRKVSKWVDENEKKLNNLLIAEDSRAHQVYGLQDRLEAIDKALTIIQNAKTAFDEQNWEQLSDFVPSFNTGSKMNNLSSMSFADDYFFYPKVCSMRNNQEFEENFSRTTDDISSNVTENSKINELIRILQLFEDPLPCVIDREGRIVNMVNSQYLVDSKGNQFRVEEAQIECLKQCQLVKILKRFDC